MASSNAYELAKQLEERHAPYEDDAANMLRQQADRIAELEKQTKPLSDEEIKNIAGSCCHGATAWHNPELDIHEFARAIEERHGIK